MTQRQLSQDYATAPYYTRYCAANCFSFCPSLCRFFAVFSVCWVLATFQWPAKKLEFGILTYESIN